MQGGGNGGPWKVLVSGLRCGPVTRAKDTAGDIVIDLEDDIGYFFFDRGCEVSGKGPCLFLDENFDSAGWGTVEFDDEASLLKALTFSGRHARNIENSASSICIERAVAPKPEAIDKDQQLEVIKQDNEALENEVRFREARAKQLERELARERKKQSELLREKDMELEVAKELARGAELAQANETLKGAEEELHQELQYEESRTESLVDFTTNVDPSQSRRHADARIKPSFGDIDGSIATVDHTKQFAPSIKNTFIHIEFEVPDIQKLVRTKTAPDILTRNPSVKTDCTPESVRPTPPVNSDEDSDWEAPTALTRTNSRPWVLKREDSRRCVESPGKKQTGMKWGDMDPEEELEEEPKAAKLALAPAEQVGNINPEGNSDAGNAEDKRTQPLAQRQVRFQVNLPAKLALRMSSSQIRTKLGEEFVRVWRLMRKKPPVIEKWQEVVKKTSAEKANPFDMIVTFHSADDAACLLACRQDPSICSSWATRLAADIMICGMPVRIDWLTAPPPSTQALADVELEVEKCKVGTAPQPRLGDDTVSKEAAAKGVGKASTAAPGKGTAAAVKGNSAKGSGNGLVAAQPASAPPPKPAAAVTVEDNPRLAGTAWGRR